MTAKPGLRQDALKAFASCLADRGHRVDWVADKKYRKCDLAIIYGYPGIGGGGRRHVVRQAITTAHDGPILVVETPLLGRKVPALKRGLLPFIIRRPDESFDRFRISLNGCFWDDGTFCNEPTDQTRWEVLARELRLEIKGYRTQGNHLLLVGQVPGDASLRGLDVLKWIEETARDLAGISERPILIRPHPRSDLTALDAIRRRLRSVPRIAWDVRPGSSLREALANAWTTITYSSGAAIDSLLMGVPAFSLSPASMAWPVTDHDIACVDAPTLFDRRPWLDQLAHSQWTIPEIENGTVWARFESRIMTVLRGGADRLAHQAG